MSDLKFDPYAWSRNIQEVNDFFSPGDIALHAAGQIRQLLEDTKDEDIRDTALHIMNVFAAIVSRTGDESGLTDPERIREAMTRMYVMGVESMRLAVLSSFENGLDRAAILEKIRKDAIIENARQAIEKRHSKPGGSRSKQEKIREIWASGKYSSRDICAEQECAALGMSFSAARKALRNTPDPA